MLKHHNIDTYRSDGQTCDLCRAVASIIVLAVLDPYCDGESQVALCPDCLQSVINELQSYL